GCDGVISPADPDARYNKHKGTGYLVQIMETFAEDDSPSEHPDDDESKPSPPDLITHVAVDPLTMHDQDALVPALDDTDTRHIKPQELLADSHYGSTECLEKGENRDVKIISPAQTAKGAKQGKLTLEDFVLDDEGRVVSYPAGHRPLKTRIAEERLQVLFDSIVCGACPDRDRCPTAAVGRVSPRYQYTHERVQHRARRLHETSDEFRDRYRWRAGVEATMSRFKHQMGMARLRIRGMQKVTFTALLRALGLNIHRVAAWKRALATV
ncbi:MAG: transposase, partial [Planctomycetaceae bacterium]|nr:transposase [Planctomycetaceae bacterium]